MQKILMALVVATIVVACADPAEAGFRRRCRRSHYYYCQPTVCCHPNGGPARNANCSADLNVSASGGGIHVNGNVDCGVKCDIDAELSAANQEATAECKAGIVGTRVRLVYDNGCVVAYGSAGAKFCNFSGCWWEWSSEVRIGRYCP